MNALRSLRRSVYLLPLGYALAGFAWIAFSDAIVESLIADARVAAQVQTWKGFGYIASTALALTVLLRRWAAAVLERDARLQRQERQYRELFASSPEPMWVFDEQSLRVLAVNDAAIAHYGWSREEFLQLSIADLRPPEDVPALLAHLASAPPAGRRAGTWRHRRRDGSVIEVDVRSDQLEFEGRKARFTLAHDVTKERAAARREARLSALYETAKRCAQAMVRLRDRERTFTEFCRIVVESGGLRGAEVLLWDGDGAPVRRIANAGSVPSEEVSVGPGRPGIESARRGFSSFNLDLDSAAPAVASPQRRSEALLPLREGGRPIGALAVYSDDPEWFDAELRTLLEELAIDFSFTLDGLRREAARAATEAALAESEERFRHLLHTVTDVAWSAPLDGSRLLYVNAAVETVYGRPARDFYADPRLWLKVVHPDDVERVVAEDARMRAEGRADYEYRIVRPDGQVRWISARTAVVHDAQGRPVRIGGLSTDITERKRAELELELAAAVFRESREAILLAGPDGKLLAVNPAFTALSGYSEAEARGRNPRFLQSGRQGREFYREMWRSIAERGYWQGELWNRGKFGDVYPIWMSVTAVRTSTGSVSHYIGIASDLSERKQAEERIERLARFDVLTGLANRSLLRLRAEAALSSERAREEGFSLLHVGLDEFKAINESLGHDRGDAILLQLALRMQRAVPAGALIARVDGDEFAVWLAGGETAQALSVADAVRLAVREPIEIDGHTLTVTSSIGVACCPRDAADFDSLQRFAAAALSRAKNAGRDACEFFQPTINAAVCERLELESGLRLALERGELSLNYQPQLELTTGRLVGVEALLRWDRPGLGSVPPSKFIPIAERCGLIQALGGWALEEACRQNRAWRDAGLAPLRVAVNLSAPQLADDGLIDFVRTVLERHRLEPDSLELEVTESMLVTDAEDVARRLAALARLGVDLALDDFGTGYSSLSYLKSFPLQRLKLDRSFVTNVVEDARDQSIARAVVAVGRALELSVIAEGIETPAQAVYLREIGCELGQGFLYGRPMQPDELSAWVATHAAGSLVGRDSRTRDASRAEPQRRQA